MRSFSLTAVFSSSYLGRAEGSSANSECLLHAHLTIESAIPRQSRTNASKAESVGAHKSLSDSQNYVKGQLQFLLKGSMYDYQKYLPSKSPGARAVQELECTRSSNEYCR